MADHRSQRPPALETDEASPLAFLAAHHVFGALPPDDLAELAAQVVVRRYAKGHRLCYTGDAVSSVFVVRSGLVALTEGDEGGDVHALVTFSSGDVFGAAAAVVHAPHSGTAVAVVDTVVLVVRADLFERFYWRCAQLAYETLRELHRLECRAQQTILRLTTKQVASRIAAFLLQSATKVEQMDAEHASLELALSHEDLAILVGTTRVTVTRVLARLSRAKIIAVSGRRVIILQPDALHQLVAR